MGSNCGCLRWSRTCQSLSCCMLRPKRYHLVAVKPLALSALARSGWPLVVPAFRPLQMPRFLATAIPADQYPLWHRRLDRATGRASFLARASRH